MKKITDKVTLFASDKNRIEGEAIEQLKKSSELKGMVRAVGLPDLHPGKGHPIGASFISQDIFYPHLVGNDIGCGMSLWVTDLKKNKVKAEKMLKKLNGLESSWEGNSNEWLSQYNLENSGFESSLGTIGGGNHFAELQSIEKIVATEVAEKLGITKDTVMLLVHSGSRGYGEHILRSHTEVHKANGLVDNTEEATIYKNKHEHAVAWAVANRDLIAHRFFEALGISGTKISDVCHNSVTACSFNNEKAFLHRKGAAPSDQGLAVIPGSRGAFSYFVKPIGNSEENAYSLAHGAGRKWGRNDTKERLYEKFSVEKLQKTELGSYVICENKDLLYEEAPQAYKDIDIVVQDLVDDKIVEIIAIFRPIITYKTRRK
jgi:release factor H-coupled RctB family protein